MELAAHAYGPESSNEERQAIADRVSVIGDRILLLDELPVQSPLSVNLMLDRVEALAANWDRFVYVVDLTAAKRPDAETRVVLKERVLRIRPLVKHVSLAVGDNLLIRAMARLFAHTMGLASVGVHATRAEAIEEARRVLDR